MAVNMSNGVANKLQFAQAFRELDPYLLKGVKKTTDRKRLGTGSYGAVYELSVQGTLCAGKQLHESLLDPQNIYQGDKILTRFVEECRIMASVRHPNIVQFLGLHFFQDSSHPILVMEKLAMSLDDLLVDTETKKAMLPLSLKVSILSDTAKGLAYLHNHKPQIIHRDLTSRNVLLTLAMQAKITDLGNALIIKSQAAVKALTQVPGTAVYMPPEAMRLQPKYDSSIDMFSYGHLALYTLIQEFPSDILSATFVIDGKILARNEVDRREKYMNSLYSMLGMDHQLTQMVIKCLSYAPSDRPCAIDVLEELEKVSKLLNDDVYRIFETSSKLDLIMMVDGSDKRSRGRGSLTSNCSKHSSFEDVEEEAPEYLQLINIASPPAATATNSATNVATLQRCEQIKVSLHYCSHNVMFKLLNYMGQPISDSLGIV
jgi:serine/threonine protein kinase